MTTSRSLVVAVTGICVLTACIALAQPGRTTSSADALLAVVNGQPIKTSHVDRLLQTRRVPDKLHAQMRPLFLQELVDGAVMRKYLADRDALPSKAEVDVAVEKFKLVAAKGGKDANKVLSAIGYTDESLREEVSLPLAWQKHVQRVVTAENLREYFRKHKDEFDGTKIRASHIFLKVDKDAPDSEWVAAEEQLREVRVKITAGELTFAEAARLHSQGPSAAQGGDLGEFPWHGKMPDAFCRVAFRLKPGEVSEPFRSPFGVHVCTVADRKPGEGNLEDVRETVLAAMSQELWQKTAAEQRAKAKIEWK